MISDAALDDLRRRNPVNTLAGKWVRLRRGGKGRMVGPCPMHSRDPNAKDSTSFECWADGWVCVTCHDGGDVIRLVMLREGKSFIDAVDWLGGAQEIDPAEAARREQEAARKRAKADADAARFREAERERVYAHWCDAVPLPGTPAADYLAVRGVEAPAGAHLRFHPQMPYFADIARPDGRSRREVIHTGWAMLAAILGPDGRFSGLHTTYIDLAQPKGKLALFHPQTGEALPAKKVRGSKQGGRIELLRNPGATRLYAGEGIETVLTVYRALARAGRLRGNEAFWSSVDLGNLGGKAADTVPHPTLTTPSGRAKRVPGPVPEASAPAIFIPDHVTELVLLADGDSDRFFTEAAMERAKAKHARPGRTVRIAWPPAGRDFNDMVA